MDALIEQSATLCNEEVLASNENRFVEDDAGKNEVVILTMSIVEIPLLMLKPKMKMLALRR